MDIVSGIIIGYSSSLAACVVVYIYTEIKNYLLEKSH
jgi:hypothetical protein